MANQGPKLERFRHVDPRGQRSRLVPAVNQSELARRLGVGRAQVNKLLMGRARPTLGTLEKLALALGVTLDVANEWLMGIRHRARVDRAEVGES